jgi:hypothetical protein
MNMATIVHLAGKREVEVRESIKRTRIRKTKEVSLKRTTRRTSEQKRNSPEMSEVAEKARRTIAGSSPERKL